MKGFTDFLTELKEYNELLESIKNNITPVNVVGGTDTQKIHLIYSIYKHTKRSCLIVTYDEMQAKKIYDDMSFFAKNNVKLFPVKEYIFYEIDAYSTDIVEQRIEVLDFLYNNTQDSIVIASLEALMQLTVPYNIYKMYTKTLNVGMIYDRQKLINDFIIMGYERVDMVEGKGQFSVRGGILDFYPLTTNIAYRIEFFDDEIDSIRELDIETQLSIEKVKRVKFGPAKEVLFDEEQQDYIINKMKKIIKRIKNRNLKNIDNDINSLVIENIKKDIEKVKEVRYFPSIDRYLTLIYGRKSTIFEYLNNDTLIFIDEPSKVNKMSKTIEFKYNETIKSMMEKGLLIEETSELIIDYCDLLKEISKKFFIGISELSYSSPDYKPKYVLNIEARTLPAYHGKMEFLYEDLKVWKNKKYRIIILVGKRSQAEKLVKHFNENELNSIYLKDLNQTVPRGLITVTHGSIKKGFEYPLINTVIISSTEIFGYQKRVKKTLKTKSSNRIKTFTDLNVGDYVVHNSHGIGLYIGMEKLTVQNIKKDYLKIRYANDDFLYVPVNQLNLIQKYIGAEGKKPKLNKLGGTDWVKTKRRVKKSVKNLAQGLINLYAARQSMNGYKFSKDTEWQRQFEDTFPYQETEDQLKCIDETKRDMEDKKSMDRLICGDVGYGKTEVAIRAAFKAVIDNKQVAYLVPTTILAQQHYNNFVQRMKDFPIKVQMLSRFRTANEQKAIIKQLKTAEIDIIIGTHKLLQKDIIFKDLGLVIIDEEQRFGVEDKEKLKNIKQNVDVLTLTATPIPRTLHMSLIGIRNISVIEQPPEDRYPVQTYVLEYNYFVIRDAIVKELSRGGQIYYLHNRVKTIRKVEAKIHSMVPEANIAVAHGQMSENQLEDVMLKVLNGEVDILICTTIIETGLDIPNVNTIIIEDADRMGLAQLYQLRGRVGRSNRIAYAYITYQKGKVLEQAAEKRLKAIKEFTEFGSGFKIAMRDLEIRGAGNILGAQQHGHIEAVGYEMYCRLLEEAVNKLKGTTSSKFLETTIDLNVAAYIPEDYIKNHNQRLDIYKKIASITNLQECYDVEEEIEDRYGDIPLVVRDLLEIALIKAMANSLQISSIAQKYKRIIVSFANSEINMKVIARLMDKYKGKFMFNASNCPYLVYKYNYNNNSKLLNNIKIILQQLKELQTE